MSPRELIYGTLFELLANVPGIKTASRRLKHWEEVNKADQPALFLVQKMEVAKIQTNLPTIWTMHADVVLYGHNSGQSSAAPMVMLNPIVDAIVGQLLPPVVPGEQTLGGLVHRCRIEGAIQTDEGALGNQAIVVIPVTLYVPQ